MERPLLVEAVRPDARSGTHTIAIYYCSVVVLVSSLNTRALR